MLDLGSSCMSLLLPSSVLASSRTPLVDVAVKLLVLIFAAEHGTHLHSEISEPGNGSIPTSLLGAPSSCLLS